MKAKNLTPLKISLHGMNDNMQKLILHCLKTLQPSIETLVVAEDEGDVEIIDVDLSAATSLAHRLAQDNIRPIIVLSLYENLSSDILYVKKPLHSSDLLAALKKAKKILENDAKTLKRNQLMADKKAALQLEDKQEKETAVDTEVDILVVKPQEVSSKPKQKEQKNSRAELLKLIATKAAENIGADSKEESVEQVIDTIESVAVDTEEELIPETLSKPQNDPLTIAIEERSTDTGVVKFPSTVIKKSNKPKLEDDDILQESIAGTPAINNIDLAGAEKLTESIDFNLLEEVSSQQENEFTDLNISLEDDDDDSQSLSDIKNLYSQAESKENEFEDFDDLFDDLGIGNIVTDKKS